MTTQRLPSLAGLVADPGLRRLVETSLAAMPAGAQAAAALASPTVAAAIDLAAGVVADGFHPFGAALPGLWRIAEETLDPALFPPRAFNALARSDVRRWGDLAVRTVLDLYDIHLFGPLSVRSTASAALRRLVTLALDSAVAASPEPRLAGVLPLRAPGRRLASAAAGGRPAASDPGQCRMADDGGQVRPITARLVVAAAYARCPGCQLVVPLDEAAEPAEAHRSARRTISPTGRRHDGVVREPAARCCACGHAFDGFAAPLPLTLRTRCVGCQGWLRAPEEAALVCCPGCATCGVGPLLDEAGHARLVRTLAERERVSRVVEDFLRRLEADPADAPPADGAAVLPMRPRREAEPGPSQHAEREPSQGGPNNAQRLAAELRGALCAAVAELADPRLRLVLTLRYGLPDDSPGQGGRTFAEIGRRLGYSPTRARQQLSHGLSELLCAGLAAPSASAFRPPRRSTRPGRRWAIPGPRPRRVWRGPCWTPRCPEWPPGQPPTCCCGWPASGWTRPPNGPSERRWWRPGPPGDDPARRQSRPVTIRPSDDQAGDDPGPIRPPGRIP